MNDQKKDEYEHSGSRLEVERFRMELGERLKYVREDILRLTPGKFEKIVPASKSSIARYETGERPVDIWFVYNVAQRANVSLEWLVTGNGPIEAHADIAEDKTQYGAPISDDERAANLKAGTELLLRSSEESEFNPPAVWSALIIELMTAHGLTPGGAGRIMETLAAIDDRKKSRAT